MSKVVVVGANHAGTAAINTLLDLYPDNEVVIFEANSNIDFLGCGMALWIGHQISTSDGLFYQKPEDFEAKGATVHVETAVERIDFENKVVYAKGADGTAYEEPYDKLILATGSLPIVPKFEGGDLENIQLVKLFQHAKEVVDKLENPDIKKVVVVGAGYIGVELAEAFERNGREVTLLDAADSCLGGRFSPANCELMTKNLRDHGIECVYGEKVERFEGEDGKVKRVITDKGAYDADMVCVCIGFRPNVGLIEGSGMEQWRNGAILVDRHQETSIKDVYAIGDCATVFDNSLGGEPNYIALATNAVRSGLVAGHNVGGTPIETPGVQGSSAICIYDLKLVSTGLTEEGAKRAGYNAASSTFTGLQYATFIESGNFDVTLTIVYDKDTRKVLGAQIMSDHDVSSGIHMFSLAIQQGLTVEDIALLDIFFLPHFNQPYNYFTMAAYQAVLAD